MTLDARHFIDPYASRLPKAAMTQFEFGEVVPCTRVDTTTTSDIQAGAVPKGTAAWDLTRHAGFTGLGALVPFFLGQRL